MKHIIILLAVLFLTYSSVAQNFEIPIYFQDSAGNKDTIVLGYDDEASYGIDPEFGEVNLIDSSYSESFEVRAAIYDYGWELGVLPRINESKKMIIDYICYDPTYFNEANSIMVVMKSNYWPITITWDKNRFHEKCNDIRIIDCTAGGWFDVCGGGHPHLLLEINQLDSAVYYDTEFKFYAEDTLNVLFFSFYNDFQSSVSDYKSSELSIFPNPTNGLIQLGDLEVSDSKIILIDVWGRRTPFNYTESNLDFSEAQAGLYFISITLDNGITMTRKIIKQNN